MSAQAGEKAEPRDPWAPLGEFREPKQGRTREMWERVIAIATEMFERGGIEALNVTEVCRLAGITPPSLYARVDGKAGLFAAVYEHGMAPLRTAQAEALGALVGLHATPEGRARAVTEVVAGLFHDFSPFLRSVIGYSTHFPELLARGAAESQALTRLMADALNTDARSADETARMIYAECVLRTMYGVGFLTGTAESEEDFIDRVARMAGARLRGA